MDNTSSEYSIRDSINAFVKNLFSKSNDIIESQSFDQEPRGTRGRLERLAKLDLESRDDFLTGFRVWGSKKFFPAAAKRFNKILEDNNIDSKSGDTSLDKVFPLVEKDHIIGTAHRFRTGVHDIMHRNFDAEFKDNADYYLTEMEGFDAAGPGELILNPDLEIPEYASYEIHTQPGGYIGNPFAGHIYHYSTNNFYMGVRVPNYQDELHTKLAGQVPKPDDQSVNRILEIGCGIGQLAVALKTRFQSAEVSGIDVAAPMIRYGHMRAVDINIPVNFSQQLAEKTNFPDNHFDIVTSYIVHHELPQDISEAVTKEAYRILRPGGVFFPIDFQTGAYRGLQGAWSRYMQWVDHRWNEEVWREEYAKFDFPSTMKAAGFLVNEKGPAAWRSRYNLVGVKV